MPPSGAAGPFSSSGAGPPSPSSRPKIDPNTPMGKLRTTLGDGFVDNFGIALLLFEMPSGFAIFGLFALYLYRPDNLWANFDVYERARHIVFLKGFQTFNDKSIAIDVDTGVNSQLTEMVMKYYRPGHTLVVGNEEYKSIIESSLHLMPRLVPGEKSELPKEDRVPMSQGLQMFLSGYGYHVKPKMVNEQIVSAASSLFHCDAVEKKEFPAFLTIGHLLKDLSGIDYKYWGTLSLAAAFNIILTKETNDFDKIFFAQDVTSKLLKDADKYKGKVNEEACLMAYKTLVSAHKRKIQKEENCPLIFEARRAHEALTELSETHEKNDWRPDQPLSFSAIRHVPFDE